MTNLISKVTLIFVGVSKYIKLTWTKITMSINLIGAKGNYSFKFINTIPVLSNESLAVNLINFYIFQSAKIRFQTQSNAKLNFENLVFHILNRLDLFFVDDMHKL